MQAHLSDNLHKEEEEEEMEEEEEAAGSHPCRPIQEDGQGCWVETEPCSRGEPAGASSRSLAASEAATQTGKADRVAGPGDAAGAPPQASVRRQEVGLAAGQRSAQSVRRQQRGFGATGWLAARSNKGCGWCKGRACV